jgi:hypothetical protein
MRACLTTTNESRILKQRSELLIEALRKSYNEHCLLQTLGYNKKWDNIPRQDQL